MGNYYYLASSLPSLQIGSPSDLSFRDFIFACRINLGKKDWEKTQVIRRYYDLENLRILLSKEQMSDVKEEEFDHHGNFDAKSLEDAVITRSGLPQYVYDFLDRYDQRGEQLRYFSSLFAAYFKEEIGANEGFLRRYLSFEREWRIVLAGFRAKVLGRDVSSELQFEDPYDDLVRQLLSQRDAETFEPPEQYRELKELFNEHAQEPLALHQALCEYRFYKIEELLGTDLFSIDRILGYMAQLITVEKWIELDKKKGLQIVEAIVKEVS